MIKKEFYKTREDGVNLFHTYSDTDHKILNKRTGHIYGGAIDVSESEEYEEVGEYIELEGADSYEEVVKIMEATNNDILKTKRKINRLNLSNNEALSVKTLYPNWDDKIGCTIEAGYITLYNGNLWKARQTHVAQEIYPPSINTASLYEVVVETHEGTAEDPIPYTPPMEIFKDKYYTQDDVMYLCIRDSGTALSHNLKDLVEIYVEII